MKINSGNVVMSSERNYYKKVGVSTEKKLVRDSDGKTEITRQYSSKEAHENSYYNQYLDSSGANVQQEGEGNLYTYQSVQEKASSNLTTGGFAGVEIDVFQLLLDRLLKLIRGGSNKSNLSVGNFFDSRSQKSFSFSLGEFTPPAQAGGRQVWTSEVKVSTEIAESERTRVFAGGNVQTEDGRSIDFSVDATMSREFMGQISAESKGKVVLTDPLVINMDSLPAGVTDMTFRFDIDCDGVEDEISTLREGSGFLALDKNGNGTIDDGSELFGTSSGNGFKDLMAYDEDGNGWIDENDSVYKQLRVWSKDSEGNDVSLSLKEADVGAIYLSSASSQFSITSENNDEIHGMVRSTGIYLKESTGAASTVQQVDMAKKVFTA